MWLTFIAIGASAFTGSAMTRTHVARAQPAMANRADEPWNADIIAKSMPTMADLAKASGTTAAAAPAKKVSATGGQDFLEATPYW